MNVTPPTWGSITPERPLVILQTNNRFGDSDEPFGDRPDALAEAGRHGREAVRAFTESVPDALKPFCQLQMELRVRDHQTRYDRFHKILDELQAAGIPANLQFADPHDQYVFDPEYVDRLTAEYPCIQSYTITEMRFEHFRSFNVARYALPPETRYTMDVIDLAARHGKHLSLSLQGVKWMHIGADVLNQPLLDKIREHRNLVLAVNEHIGPQHLPRQTSVMGMWIAEMVDHWGVEPQSWWFENGRMITPGVFGQYQADNTRNMPPLLYRAMLLQGALLGATVYQFEPFWDLFDYDNSICWREVIAPTLLEIINERLIPAREQVRDKMKVAYQYKLARDINEFHENLRDVDYVHDEGLLEHAAYGVWELMLEHELVPKKHRYFFIPLLPPRTPANVLDHFAYVIQPGECGSVAEYEALLDRHYPKPDPDGTAWTASVNAHRYVMHTHANLYRRQTWAADLPKAVREITAAWMEEGLRLDWEPDLLASRYHVCRRASDEDPWVPIDAVIQPPHTLREATRGERAAYTVLAETDARERVDGAVNYLDFLRFSETVSRPVEECRIHADGHIACGPIVAPVDNRPESQIVYPTFDGAESHPEEAREIVARIDAFKRHYDAGDWRGVSELYALDYEDGNGYHKEYADRAWKWWFLRMNRFHFLRQIRQWDFSDYAGRGIVRVRMFTLCRALRRDDQPFGYGFHGTCRIPRTPDEEVTFTWARDPDGAWRIRHTDPALPNFLEILWNSRGSDKSRLKLTPGRDGEPEHYTDPGHTNLIPIEQDWLNPPK